MNPAQDPLWCELEPLLDDAMLTLSQRQRELVLCHYFQNNSQRAAADLVGCSESVASRELSTAIENLRRFFARQGVTISGTALVTLLTTNGAQAFISTAGIAGTLASASAMAGASTVGNSLLFTIMKMTTTAKIIAAAAAVLLVTSGAIHHLMRNDARTAEEKAEDPAAAVAEADSSQATTDLTGSSGTLARRAPRVAPAKAEVPPTYDEDALKVARQRQERFMQRMGQLALMGDPSKVQELLASEYGIQLSVDEIRNLQKGGQKGFTLGILELWPSKQPHDALAWASSVYSGIGPGVDFHHRMVEAARKALPDLNRDMLAGLLPDGPGKAKMLDLVEAATDPHSLVNRILATTDPTERSARLKLLAQAWPDTQASAQWARENLSGNDKTTFYAQVGYELAERNPSAALQILAELQGTDAYASTFAAMMRGLVQEGGRGHEAAELLANSNLSRKERIQLISELARRWTRSDADATIAWVNTLSDPEDFRAAVPLLVSQLDNDRVRRTVDAYLQNLDPVMEAALIEAAAPSSLVFDPQKSRLILDPLINKDPDLKLRAGEGKNLSKEQMLWDSVNRAAKRQAEAGQPGNAIEWLATLPFDNESDYARAIASVWTVWNLKSQTEAVAWLQNSALNPPLKVELLKTVQP